MLRKNPYYIQDNIRLDLRDSKGRFTTASRAKKFYLYVDGQLADVGEFSKVSLSVSEKDAIISEAVNELYAMDYADPLITEPRPEPRPEPEFVEEFEPDITDRDDELGDLLYDDLLSLLEEEFPLDYSEVTGKKVPSQGRTRKQEKVFDNFTFANQKQDRQAINDFYSFKLNIPINLSTKDPNDLIDILERNLLPDMKRVFDRKTDGENFFIVAIHFSYKDINTGQMKDQGLSMSRFEATNWDEFLSFIRDDSIGLYRQIQQYYAGYLKNSMDNSITTLGFKIEHLHTIG